MVTAATANSTDKKQQWSGIILDNTVFQCSKQWQWLLHMTRKAIIESNNQLAAIVKIVRNNNSVAEYSEGWQQLLWKVATCGKNKSNSGGCVGININNTVNGHRGNSKEKRLKKNNQPSLDYKNIYFISLGALRLIILFEMIISWIPDLIFLRHRAPCCFDIMKLMLGICWRCTICTVVLRRENTTH